MGNARTFLVAVFLAFAVAGASSAGPYEDAVAAYERADYATAARLWRPLAERGDPAAQLRLGSMLHDGLGVPQDFAEALDWFRRAADQGKGAGSDCACRWPSFRGPVANRCFIASG
jgi:TPR repeat protein